LSTRRWRRRAIHLALMIYYFLCTNFTNFHKFCFFVQFSGLILCSNCTFAHLNFLRQEFRNFESFGLCLESFGLRCAQKKHIYVYGALKKTYKKTYQSFGLRCAQKKHIYESLSSRKAWVRFPTLSFSFCLKKFRLKKVFLSINKLKKNFNFFLHRF